MQQRQRRLQALEKAYRAFEILPAGMLVHALHESALWYIVAKWGLLPSECVYIYIERNFDVENLIIKMAQDFLEAVKTKQPPDLK